MLERHFLHALCLFLSLIVLKSEVHSFDSGYKYVFLGGNHFRSTPDMRKHPERSKLFTLEETFYSQNDETMKAFGREVKTAASAVTREQQDIEVIANSVRWAARVNQGNVEDVECSWVGPLNVTPVQAYMSRLTKTKGVEIPSHIKSMMINIYESCLGDCALLECSNNRHRTGFKSIYVTREFD